MRSTYLTTDSRRLVTRRAAKLANEAWQAWLQTSLPPESLLARRLAQMPPRLRHQYITENAPFKADWKGQPPGLALKISALDAPLIDEAVRKQMERIVAEAMLKAMVHHKRAFLGALLRDQIHNDPPYYQVEDRGRVARIKHKVSRAATSLRFHRGH